MDESTIILRDRFKSLEESLDLNDKDFAFALFDYCAYICSSEKLSQIVQEMAKEDDIDRETFHWLFMFGALRNSFRNLRTGKMEREKDLGLPLFFDKEIEDNYHVAEALMGLLSVVKNAPHLQDKEDLSVYDLVSDETGKFLKNEDVPIKKMIIKFRSFQSDLLSRLIKPKRQIVSFDANDSALKIGNKKILFRKHTEQYHTLKIIFEDQSEIWKEWFFSEIAEKIDQYKGYSDKDFHNYLSAIKKRVSTETGIKDLFITTNQSVTINKKYLE